MISLFSGCKNLEKIPELSYWDMRKVIDISWIFYECDSLIIKPDITKWNINKNALKCEIFKRNINSEKMPISGMDLFNEQNINVIKEQFPIKFKMK